MNPGVGQEAGETARTVVAALQSTPAILALVIFNLSFIGVLAWITYLNGSRWQELLELTLKQCGPHPQ